MPAVRKSVETKAFTFAGAMSEIHQPLQRLRCGLRFMSSRVVLGTMAAAVCAAGCLTAAEAQVNVTMYHNDIGRTGQNLNETQLNLTNVNASSFGKLFSQKVDGQVYAQPLYLSNITVNGAQHNVLFVATEHDSIYAFDADSNGGVDASPLWMASMLTSAHGAAAGAAPISANTVSSDISPEVGITGTPVIDASTGTLYVVSKALENSVAVQRLHALDVKTGAEKFGGPVVITASVSGTGNGSVNGTLTFDSLWQNQRPALLLLNGIVYIGFASHGDNGPWHGWILGYKASSLQQVGAYCASPNGTGSGFWMSGAGLAADVPAGKPFGRMFVASGNGDYNATKPYSNSMDFGNSHIALDLTNGQPTVTDEFTTNQQASLNSEDGDVGSGGLVVIPDQPGANPHLAAQVGKGGSLYLLNRENLGGYNTSADQVLQEQAYAVGNVGAWSTPAYWNGSMYFWGRFDNLKKFPIVNGLLTTTPTKSTEQYAFPGSTPSISANGTSQGIVWSIDSSRFGNPGPSILQAHDATNVATTLYSSATNTARDTAGNAVKFTVPTVVNGKVYVGAAGEVDVYGLLNGVTQTNAPVITPGTESYQGTISVTITDSTPGASIYYTVDGSQASTSSTLYTAPISVNSTETIHAIASASGLLLSAQSTATYTNVSRTDSPVFSIPTGTYTSTQTVTISDATAGSKIYYTTDGSTPTASSTLYSGPITVSATETITAIGITSGLSNSPVIAQTYTIQLGGTGPSFPSGFANSTGQIILNGSVQLNDTRLQLTNGLNGQNGSAWYVNKQNIQSFTNDFTFQLSNPNGDGMTFAIQNAPQNVNSIGGSTYQLGYAPIPNSIGIKFDLYDSAGEGPNSTGLYLNGANPTQPSINLTGTGIDLHSDDTMSVHMTYDGTTLTMRIYDLVTSATFTTSWAVNIPQVIGSSTAYVGFTGSTGADTASQKILTWTFASSSGTTPTAATPTFSPAAGTYTSAQNVAISDATSGASIYYTTDNSTPTTSSAKYSGTISVTASETIKAIAVASGYSNSGVASATYTIGSSTQVATPTFSLPSSVYYTPQTMTISDATAGAKIYYTFDGTTPTTSSYLYAGPISLTQSRTIKAIAVATGMTNSTVAATIITLTVANPSLSPAGGTYSGAQTVTVTSATPSATFYYTTNGQSPTTSSTRYTGPITVGASETLKVLGGRTGFSPSGIVSATYTITSGTVTATPTFSPAGGTYTAAQTVTISDATAGSTIYYTVNGTTPSTGSTVYSGPINVASTETVQAIAVAAGVSSPVAAASYTISAGTPAISYGGGFTTTGLFTSGATVTGGQLHLTDGGAGEARTAWFATPVNVQTFTTDFNFQQTSATADGFTFVVQGTPQGVYAIGGNGYALGYGGMGNSVAVKFDLYDNSSEGSDSTGIYVNGATPTVPSVDMTNSGIDLHSAHVMHAHITYDGTTLTLTITDTTTNAVFTTAKAVNIPATVGGNTALVGFTASTGGLTAVQNILSWTYSN